MKARLIGSAAACLALLAPVFLAAQEAMPGMEMDHSKMFMPGMYGPYSMTREATGTSWQPDSTPHEGLNKMLC